jgi:hypothetical protein
MGKWKQGQQMSRGSYVLWLGGERKAWNKCLELAARRGKNYQNISGRSRGGEETVEGQYIPIKLKLLQYK